jgi:Flp pilus assembly protein TadG
MRNIWRHNRGAVAIEAAIIIPLLLIAIVAVIDTVRFIGTATRLDQAAAIAADLAARSETLVDQVDFAQPTANNALAMFFLSANQVALPSNLASDGQVILSAIQPTVGGYQLLWQRSGPYALAMQSRLSSLPQLPTSGTHVVAEVFFRFRPAILESLGVLSAAEATLYRRAVFRVRKTALTVLE